MGNLGQLRVIKSHNSSFCKETLIFIVDERLEKKQASIPKATPERPALFTEQFTKKAMFKVLFDFEARNPDEMNLKEVSPVQVYSFLFICHLNLTLIGPICFQFHMMPVDSFVHLLFCHRFEMSNEFKCPTSNSDVQHIYKIHR